MFFKTLNKIKNLATYQKKRHEEDSLNFDKIHGPIFLLSEVFRFYINNFFKIFTIGSFYFVTTSIAIIYGSIYLDSYLGMFLLFTPLFLIYLFTISKLITEGGDSIGGASIYAFIKFVPLSITTLLSVLVIFGMLLLFFIPEFAILTLFKEIRLLNIIGGVIFIMLSLITIIYYSMFLLVTVDEEKYGFKALIASKNYVSTDFLIYLSRLTIGIVLVPITFYLMLYAAHGIFVAIEIANVFFNVHYDIFKLQNTIQEHVTFYQFYIRGQSVLLEAWFVTMVFVIPIYITYSSFLYFSLSGRNLINNKMDITFLHKFILTIVAILGVLAILTIALYI